jgi:dienelactone hydrolase
METQRYEHLGPYGDLVGEVAGRGPLHPRLAPGPESQRLIRGLLGFDERPEAPLDVRVERTWTEPGLRGEELSWSVGYGPRTRAWLLLPLDAAGPVPGVVALHDHGGFKFLGREKIADGPDGAAAEVAGPREVHYGDRPFANDLARRGLAVLVHDVFLWGSRRFPEEAMPDRIRAMGGTTLGLDEVDRYNLIARPHEDLVAKYCAALGISLSGIIAHEDRIAVSYLKSRPEVNGIVGCIGLSGGGCRAALLQASSDDVSATVVVGMMSTQAALLDRHVDSHTWMFFPPGLARHGDWPDLAACRAPSPLMVQYDLDDGLFPQGGMRDAHQVIAAHYEAAGDGAAYVGEFYPGPHKFDRAMQAAAFDWLGDRLARAGG